MPISPSLLHRLEAAVHTCLLQHPRGVSEFELIGLLREAQVEGFLEARLSQPLSLFRTHFLLFHLLYRLRDRLRREQSADLAIGPLRIALDPYQPATPGLTRADPLRDYYLDWRRLEETDEQEVEGLLNGFWRRHRSEGEWSHALAVLGLDEAVDYAAIKRRYRSLAMRHHPDRGGSKRRLQEINRAMRVLTRHFR